MNKRAIFAATISLLLAACSTKTAEEGTRVDPQEEITTEIPTESPVLEEHEEPGAEVTEIPKDISEEACKSDDFITTDADTTIPENENGGIGWIVLEVRDVPGGFQLQVGENEDVIDSTTVNGEKINGNTSTGNIIRNVSSAADFGITYSASYDIYGNNLEKEVFTVIPAFGNGLVPEYGMNYLEYYLAAGTGKAERIDFRYKDRIVLTGQEGDFDLTIYPLSRENRAEACYEKIVLAGTADEPTDITVAIRQSSIYIDSNREIRFSLEAELPGKRINETIGPVMEYSKDFR